MVLMGPFQLKDILFLYNFLTLAYLIAPRPVSKMAQPGGLVCQRTCPVQFSPLPFIPRCLSFSGPAMANRSLGVSVLIGVRLM